MSHAILTLAVFSALLLVPAASLLPIPSAQAVIGGEVDGTAHPYAGAIDARPAGRGFGSGVLVSPTVYVTAGHATRFFDDAGLTRARVTFDPIATDPGATFYEGTVHTHPGFSGRVNDPTDVGVVVFDSPVPGITPAQLPTANMLVSSGPEASTTNCSRRWATGRRRSSAGRMAAVHRISTATPAARGSQ